MADLSFVDVGPETAFVENRLRIVEVDGKEIGVGRSNGRWFALRNICPHLGAPVCAGRVLPRMTGDASTIEGEWAVDWSRPAVMCPWHRWEFDLERGDRIGGKEKVKTYPVSVEDGRVKVAAGGRARNSLSGGSGRT
jgi:nitrite reductase (NADH) small subunit